MTSPFSLTVLCAADGWVVLLMTHGTRSLAQVLAPTIEFAESGFPVPKVFNENSLRYGATFEGTPERVSAYFKDGEAPGRSDVSVNKPIGWACRQITRGGLDAFYEAGSGRRILERLNSLGWPVPMDDLAIQCSDRLRAAPEWPRNGCLGNA